ncbi:MAG TPA: hypothetical protein VKT28_09985 [Puia sp.]|nr:hypothetical protein [Puia sp.]
MRKYQRAIVFTKVPLGGYYRYKDMFQIFPADFKDMPQNPYQKHYPNILEYWFTDDEKIIRESEYENLNELFTSTATIVTKEDRIISLLNSFTNNIFFKYNYEGIWAIPVLFDVNTNVISEEINSLTPKWSIKTFHFPTLSNQLQITKFTNLSYSEIKKIAHLEFYTRFPNLDNDNERSIVFPETFDSILDSYFSIEKELQTIIDSAIGYNMAAIELWGHKKTIGLLASFTAVETMVNLEYRQQKIEKCENCGQLKFSVAKKFREYLLKYIGSSNENKKKFNSYYNLRSKIVHTGARLKAEILFSEVSKKELETEYITRVEILQIGKLSIANWLLLNTKQTNFL